MNLEINIERSIFKQFSEQLKCEISPGTLLLDSSLGEGVIRLFEFPNTLEFHHFTFNLRKEFELRSTNPIDSDYVLLNINLSEQIVEKTVNQELLNFHKYLPSGILYYPPNSNVYSKSPINTKFEIVLIRFHKDLLLHYLKKIKIFSSMLKTPLYMKIWIQNQKS